MASAVDGGPGLRERDGPSGQDWKGVVLPRGIDSSPLVSWRVSWKRGEATHSLDPEKP